MMGTEGFKNWRCRSGMSWIRMALVIFVLVFLWMQLNISTFGGHSSQTIEKKDSTVAILSMVPAELHIFLSPKQQNTFLSNGSGSHNNSVYTNIPINTSEIIQKIAQYNLEEVVRNANTFGPLRNDSLVVVVQIHDRITYLRYLIVSFAQARGISQVLLIFSHDYYDEEINRLVESIDFCKVLQIFYPHSIQAHPNEFPGDDPGDCPRNMKKEHALLKNCNNALYPDVYGHYREAKFTQSKHHWWWKSNRVFSQLEITRNHTGLVLFLEEDHYVAEDFLHILRLMERKYKKSCRHCNVLSLGTYQKTYNYYSDFQKIGISPWMSHKHNMGMAFNRSTWKQIVECSSYFCEYDDYNWDWSLQHVSQECLNQKLYATVARAPRVFHIGECGVHHKKNNCKVASVLPKVLQVLKSSKKHLYPDDLILTHSTLKKTILRKAYGGWGDRRDHKLCMGMTVS